MFNDSNILFSNFLSFFNILNLLIFILYFLVIFFLVNNWNLVFKKFKPLKKYDMPQKIHENETPRLGGATIFIFMYFSAVLNLDLTFFSILHLLLLTFLPIFVITIKEDLFHNSSAIIRLLMMIISSFIFIFLYSGELPKTSIIYLDFFLENQIICTIFYMLCLVSLMNGMNLIDGANGLLGVTVFIQLISFIFLSLIYKDPVILNLSFFILFFLLIFLYFNYPSGKIFFGDTGAYLFGFLIGIICIMFFSNNKEANPLLSLVILFYPIFEISFSFFRKVLFYKVSPFLPDKHHLHGKIFTFFNSKIKLNIQKSNQLIMPTIFLIWLTPFFGVILSYRIHNLVLLVIFFQVISYLILYYGFSKKI